MLGRIVPTPDNPRSCELNEMKGLPMMVEQLGQDIRNGFRALRRGGGATAMAVLVLALGIGANVAMFSVAHAYLLRTWQVRQPEQLAFVDARAADGDQIDDFSWPIVEQLRRATRGFAGISAFDGSTVTVTIDGDAEIVYADFVTGDYFQLLDLHPALGRPLTLEDDRPGRPPVAVISYGYWQRRFAGDPHVIGKTIALKNITFTIVGVHDNNYFGRQTAGSPLALTLPMAWHTALGLKDHTTFGLLGRLRPDVTREAARTELDILYQRAQIDERNAAPDAGATTAAGTATAAAPAPAATAAGTPTAAAGPATAAGTSTPPAVPAIAGAPTPAAAPALISAPAASHIELRSALRGSGSSERFEREVWILQLAAALVLLLATVNVASLQLARGAGRQRELATRLALGATRPRLVRQLLAEGLIVSAAGGLLGLVAAQWGADALVALPRGSNAAAPSTSPSMILDAPVLAVTFAAILLAALLSALVPAIKLTRADQTSGMSTSLRTRTGDRAPRAGWSLIVVQVALSIVLLIPAGLLVRSIDRLTHVDLGFNPNRLLVMSIYPTLAGYEGPREMALYERILDRLNALPGIDAASFSRFSILRRARWHGLTIHGDRDFTDPSASFVVDAAAPRLFDALGLRLLAGRDFARSDTPQSARVAVINQALADRYFPEGHAVGRSVEYEGVRREIIGVVSNMLFEPRDERPAPAVYISYTQAPPDMLGQMAMKIRTTGEPTAMIPTIRRELQQLAPGLTPAWSGTAVATIAEDSSAEMSLATLVSACGLIALLLALVGLYGTLTQAVTRRTREIGVRVALGAQARAVTLMIMGEVGRLVMVGVAVGVPLAWAAAHLVASFLFGVTPADLSTSLVCALLVSSAVAIAAFIPARRAARIDPLIAIQRE